MPRPTWDEYALNLLDPIASRSEDQETKVGCVIFDTQHRIVGTGYNSFPKGINYSGRALYRPVKYKFMVHAEANAILFSDNQRLRNATIYVPFKPCNECCKLIIQSGIYRVVYRGDYISQDKEANSPDGTKMLRDAGVVIKKFTNIAWKYMQKMYKCFGTGTSLNLYGFIL